MSAIKGLIGNGLENPIVRRYLGSYVNASTFETIGQVVESFDGSVVGDLQESLNKSLATQDFGHIVQATTSLYTNVAGNFNTNDGVKAYDQE
jgi:hypothetical protein